jgi:hypothetical protein
MAAISVVAELATHVDELLAEHWEDPGLTLAIARSAIGGRPEITIVSIDDRPLRSVAEVPATRCAAACLAALGTIERLGHHDGERVPVRLTATVSCCEAVVLVRHRDGRVDKADEASGPMIELLREWANHMMCRSCATMHAPTTGSVPADR